jgi:DNA-binding NarL/FixJ family response regulator
MEQQLSKKRVLVVEQESLPPWDIHDLIDQQPDLASCSQPAGTSSIAAAISLEKPDVVLLGVRLDNGDGFELTNVLKLEFPELPILLFCDGDETLYAERALQAGAKGYIMKQESEDELLTAIRTVLSGKIYLSHSMSIRVVQRVLKPGSSRGKYKPA